MSAAIPCLLLQNHSFDFPSQGERENEKCITLFITQLSIFCSLYTYIYVYVYLYKHGY